VHKPIISEQKKKELEDLRSKVSVNRSQYSDFRTNKPDM